MSQDFTETQGKPITCQAAVAWEANKPLDVTTIQVDVPKKHEVRLKIFSNALCHTDIYTLEGHDPEGLFPCILGHEATGIVESIGEGVTSVAVGDIVIPCYTPECREHDCLYCKSEKTNLCPKIRATQGKGLMPDGTSRFSKDGKSIFHFMGCSTFSEYTVVAEISCAKINSLANVEKVCVLGCGVSTGWGAAINTCKVTAGSTCVIFGLGAVGLAVIQACKQKRAKKIIGVDLNPNKFKLAEELGATECVNPSALGTQTVKDYLLAQEKWGFNFTFDCTGSVKVMRDSIELAHRGIGESCIIGVAASGQEIQTRPFQLVTGRVWKGTAFGGWKSRTEVPQLVNKVLTNEISIDSYVTHTINGLENVNQSIEALHSGDCIRAVVSISKPSQNTQFDYKVKVKEQFRHFNGTVKRCSHLSRVNKTEMNFTVYIPDFRSRTQVSHPALFFLAGLTCSDETALIKSGFGRYASEYGLAVVFPDTSCKLESLKPFSDHWDFGTSAGFYLDATQDPWKVNFQNYSYITKELPQILSQYFPINIDQLGITGHSMGGHGAVTLALKNPQLFKTVSAFAPILHPTQGGWGKKAFQGYLGSIEAGEEYDATLLVKKYQGPKKTIFIEQGEQDIWLHELFTEAFAKACQEAGQSLKLRYQPGHSHGYFFVQTFIEDHISFHATQLGLTKY